MTCIEDLKKQPHLSASSIGDYMDCGLLYKLSRIDKCKPDHISYSLIFGSVIHKAIADLNIKRMKTGNIMPVESLLESFEQHWTEAADGNDSIRYNKAKDFNTLLKEGKGLLNAYYESTAGESFKVICVEEAFQFTIDGIDIPIVGIMDVVEEDEAGTIIIADYKTSSKAWSSDQVDNNFQVTIYQMAAKANGYANREILLRFDCLIKTKKPKFEQYYTARTDVDENRLIMKIQQVWEGIQKGVFLPNDTGWKCNNCAYKSHCIKWFKGGA